VSLLRTAALLLLPLLLFSLWSWHREDPQQLSRSRLIMGTVVEITVLGGEPGRRSPAIDAAFSEMARIEALMSPQLADSDVARLSRSEAPLAVAPETAAVISKGLEVAAASGGRFDLTLGQLKALWDFEDAAPQVPSEAAIAAALAGIGPTALRLDGMTVSKSAPLLAVDLGGIAKGYAVDRAIAVLRQHGIEHASVNAGGDLRLLGDRQGRPWRIAIQHPRQADQVLAIIPAADQAVITSGDYERFFFAEGLRYHHLLDPISGFPASASQSVTVVAAEAMLADALATAAFIMGPADGLPLIESFGAEGLVVDRAGLIHLSSGLRERIEWP
jgi:FAD:protein FMN transferase